MALTADASGVVTGGGIMSEGGGGEDFEGYVLAYPRPLLGVSNRSHHNIQR